MEIAARELDSRLLVALHAVQQGFEVVLGQKWLMETNFSAMPKGTWLFKTMTPRDSRAMRKAKALGHGVAAIDEEVTALAEGTGGLTWVSDDGVALADRIFCQGTEHESSMTKRWPQHQGKLRVTGNPRWDILRPELRQIFSADADALIKAHGPIILINTNSSIGNPAKGRTAEQLIRETAKAGKIKIDSEEDKAKWRDYLAFDRANLESIVKLVRALSVRHPGHFIVVRPHPSEEGSYYENALTGIKNAAVIFKGSAATWIAAAEILIHTQCTTGIEAYALGKPAVNYEVMPSKVSIRNISGRLSMVAKSENDVLLLVERRLARMDGGEAVTPERTATFRRFFAAQDGALSAERIMVELRSMAIPAPDMEGKATWRPGWSFLPRWRMTAHRRKVFPPVEAADLQARMAQMAKALGMGMEPEVLQVGDTVFHVRNPALSPPLMGSITSRFGGRILGRV